MSSIRPFVMLFVSVCCVMFVASTVSAANCTCPSCVCNPCNCEAPSCKVPVSTAIPVVSTVRTAPVATRTVTYRRGLFTRSTVRSTARFSTGTTCVNGACSVPRSAMTYECRQPAYTIVEEPKAPRVKAGVLGLGILPDRVVVPSRTKLTVEQ